MTYQVPDKKNIKDCVLSIARELKNRADDITNDIEDVRSININAKIEAGEVVNFDIIKNYLVGFEEKEENNE